MKIALLLTFTLLLLGCSDERSQVVVDYLLYQNKKDTAIQVSVKRIEAIDNISARDSLEILEVEYDRKREKFIRGYNDLMLSSQSLKNNMSERSKIQSAINGQPLISDLADSTAQRLVWIDALEKRAVDGNAAAMIYKQKQLVELRKIAERINRYEENPGDILARTALVTYSIKNANDEKADAVTKTFVFSEDGKRVLNVSR